MNFFYDIFYILSILDEITMLPKDKITLSGEDLEMFNRLLTLLDDIEDVNHVYHNVEL